ncbi:MAG: hypothetical protein HOW73_27840 [Polyangiaceae bacterium]|nr:hypothetical protein [Polyangiaceae bacterium]
MSTPTFKLLLNALRLGLPQDPQGAVFALAEALAAQEDTIDELRRRVQLVQSAAQILETKAARLELELETLRRAQGGAPISERSPAMSTSPSFGPPPNAHIPPGQAHASNPPPLLPPREWAASSHPRSDPPPPMSAPPSQLPPSGRQSLSSNEDSDSFDDFKVSTVVVQKQDIQALMGPEAPFRLPPPGQPLPPRGSIPGAPWAKSPGGPSQPPIADDYTLDAHHDPRDEGDEGETYSDAGATSTRPPKR